MKIETQIKLDKFKPRKYQLNLSLAIEEGKFRKYLLIWPRRCLAGDTFIIMADGSYKYLKDVRAGDLILSWDGGAFVPDKIVDKWQTDVKPTVHVSSSKQPLLTSSKDHVFATVKSAVDKTVEWVALKNIENKRFFLTYAGMECGTVNKPELAEFLGYMQADGYVSGYQQPKFTNTNKEILDRVALLAAKLFDIKVIWRKKGNGFDLGFSNGTKGGGTFKNPIKELFRSFDADHGKAKRRLLPVVWTFDRESLLRFFSGLISADGSMYIAKNGFVSSDRNRHIPPAVEIAISCGLNHDYAMDTYWLCRKLGLLPQQIQYDKGSNWKIRISRAQDIKVLLTYPILGKQERQKELLSFIKNYNKEKSIFLGCHRFSIKTSEGPAQQLYDLETQNNHNFVANGYLVHNSGKDFTIFNMMLRCALRRVGSYFYCLPTFKQARLVIWDSITISGEKFLSCIPKELIKRMNQQEMFIELVNGSIIRLIGSDTFDTSLVGTNPLMIVFSEYALADKRAYTFVRPILNANEGTVIVASTPRGHNHFYDLYQIAKSTPDEWFCELLTIDDTNHIPIESIKRDIANGEISEELAKQEYECDFSLGIEGSYYGHYMDKMRLEGRIGEVPYEPGHLVHCAFDLGMNNATVIVFFQVIGAVVHIIDYYQNTSQGLEHYAKYLNSKQYTYGKMFAPHDIAVRELGTGMSRLEKAKQLGMPLILGRALPLKDGIEAVRTMLPRCWIDEKKCKRLIKALENYRREYDEKHNVYFEKPVHDSHSDACDGFRYCAVNIRRLDMDSSPEELERRYRDTIYGQQSNLPPIFDDRHGRGY